MTQEKSTQDKPQVPPHALVVDDNADSAETLALLIEMEGFSVACAASLKQAREQLLRQAPQLVFLDLTLPDGSGMDLLEQTAAMAGTGVVVLSGSADPQAADHARRLGAIDYLVKPANMTRLQALLDQIKEQFQ